jgi:ParB family chromosome partitioning protein
MTNNKGLGKGLGALISLFDEDMEEISAHKNNSPQNVPRGTFNDPSVYDGRRANEGGSVEQTKSTLRGTFPKAVPLVENKKDDYDILLTRHGAMHGGVQEIDINLIDKNVGQPRKDFDPEAMHELEQSISANGVLQPILLNRVGTRYRIVAGERRFRASKNVGLKTIPAIVREYTTRQIAEIALVENLLRSDLNEMEIANGIRKLMDTHLLTQEQVSKVLCKPRSAIANSLRFLSLPKEVQNLLEQKKISAGHAKILAAITDTARCTNLANQCAAGMSVRELETQMSGKSQNVPRGTFSAGNSGAKQSIELKQFALHLTHNFATRVNISGNDNKGKIIIEYNTKKDLERIMEKLK